MLLVVQVTLSLLLILFVFLFSKRAKKVSNSLRTLPGRVAFFGDTFTIIKNRNCLLEWITDSFKTGPYQSGRFFNQDVLFRLTPDASTVKHILKDNWKNYRIPVNRNENLGDLVGRGIFGVDGDEWHRQRKAASHLLTANRMKGTMTRIFSENTVKVISLLDQYAKNQAPFDIQDLFFRYTMDSFCKIAFGEDVNSLEADEPPALARAFDNAQLLSLQRIFRPYWRFQKFFNIGAERQLANELKIIKNSIYKSIETRASCDSQKEEDDDEEGDLITAFYKLAKKSGQTLSKEYMADVMINFLIAGRDTTACAMSWFIYEMHLNPEVEQKIYEEICDVLGLEQKNQKEHVEVRFEHAPQLKYLEGALLEALRLHPSVPLESREAIMDDVLPNGLKIPAGVSVDYAPYIYGRSPEIWTDPLKFDPTRWTGPDPPDAYMYPTFNAGPRVCLGRKLALYEMKLLVASMMQKYKFSVQNVEDVTYSITLTLNIKDQLSVKAVPRVTA